MNHRELVEHVHQDHPDLSKKQIKAIVTDTIDYIKAGVEQQGEFSWPGFGKIVSYTRKARMGRNPQTGEAIKIKAKKVLKFRPAKAFKEMVL